jgi:radical SAM protein with 4Fe4S-binding SPASM domain
LRGDCSIRIEGLGFTPEQIAACTARTGLLSIEIELATPGRCACATCQSGQGPGQNVLELDELIKLLDAARSEGAQRCILVDSEPESSPHLPALVDYLHQHQLQIELFTGGQGIMPESAAFLFQRGVSVVAQCDLDHPAIRFLREAGFKDRRLAIRVPVDQENLSKIPDWWRRVRGESMEPYVQIMTPADGGDRIAPNRARQLFEDLAAIDAREFARDWPAPPSLIGRSCKRHLFACHVTPCGTVYPCVGVTIPLGNVRGESLRDILNLSEVLEHVRDFHINVKEPCRTCSKSTDCYGCRGSAFQLTGDYLAGDQLCWKAEGVEIRSFPVSINGLVPHGPPIRIVDNILAIGERRNHAELVIRPDSPFLDESGTMDELAFIEMIAQAFAACHGFLLSAGGTPLHRGLLLGIKDLTITGRARAGDRLRVLVRKLTRFGDFGVVEGTITHEDGRVLAKGQIKVWQPGEEGAKAIFG